MFTNNDGATISIIAWVIGAGSWTLVYLIFRSRKKKRLAEEEKLDASVNRGVTIAKIKEFKVRMAKRKA